MSLSPSDKDAMIAFRLQRAQETLAEAQVQMDHGFWRLAVNRLYYASFYGITALLITKDEFPKTHKGVRQRFALLFVATGVFPRRLADAFTELFERRHSGDYDDFVNLDPEDVARLQPLATELVRMIESRVLPA